MHVFSMFVFAVWRILFSFKEITFKFSCRHFPRLTIILRVSLLWTTSTLSPSQTTEYGLETTRWSFFMYPQVLHCKSTFLVNTFTQGRVFFFFWLWFTFIVIPLFFHFQIIEEDASLVEIGPRFVLNLIKIFQGSFGGPTLYENPNFRSPNLVKNHI